jgi:hypothetical protein
LLHKSACLHAQEYLFKFIDKDNERRIRKLISCATSSMTSARSHPALPHDGHLGSDGKRFTMLTGADR